MEAAFVPGEGDQFRAGEGVRGGVELRGELFFFGGWREGYVGKKRCGEKVEVVLKVKMKVT